MEVMTSTTLPIDCVSLANLVDRRVHGCHGAQALLRQLSALAGQLVGLRRGMCGADDVLGDFLDGRGHLGNGGGGLIGFTALTIQRLRLGTRECG
jgi:hypothetical protein